MNTTPKTTKTPITTSGIYAHTDGTVGEYTWIDGFPSMIRVGADCADIERQREDDRRRALHFT